MKPQPAARGPRRVGGFAALPPRPAQARRRQRFASGPSTPEGRGPAARGRGAAGEPPKTAPRPSPRPGPCERSGARASGSRLAGGHYRPRAGPLRAERGPECRHFHASAAALGARVGIPGGAAPHGRSPPPPCGGPASPSNPLPPRP
ncbi:MAG: hypothetical protein B7L53_02660 [Thermofilum sp. NZ13]|nr:MAG: hypothetical protein B7L53_02660 [Thermofilum sp. NZ13]